MDEKEKLVALDGAADQAAELIEHQVVARRGATQQLGTLTRRYIRVIAADRGYLLSIGLMPIILGVLSAPAAAEVTVISSMESARGKIALKKPSLLLLELS